MCILESSKAPMYEFHYNYVKSKYGNSLRLFFTNTVSLVYEIETGNVYGNFRKNKIMFDCSKYSS